MARVERAGCSATARFQFQAGPAEIPLLNGGCFSAAGSLEIPLRQQQLRDRSDAGPIAQLGIADRFLAGDHGFALALLSGLLLFSNSALRRYRQLLERSDPSAREALVRLYPAAREEASWLGQQLPAPP